MTHATGRVRAPELRGDGGWINTAAPLSLAELRGRVVLLDFWTFCCINCLRVIEEVRSLEERFGDRLVVVGVHSPKFPHEADHDAVVRAVSRHRITHPVLDDPAMETWQRYGVRAWPTLVVIDPAGYVVASAAGEGKATGLGEVIAGLLEGAQEPPAGTSHPASTTLPATGMSFPGKVTSDGGSRIAVADTGHDRVLVCDLGGGAPLAFDGFHQPQGVRFDGTRLVVCDTVVGELVAIDLPGGARTVLAEGMRSPWDAAVLGDGGIVVAEAGAHRLLTVAGTGGPPAVLAGTGAEGLRDGPAEQAHLAQPSGLAVLEGGELAIADAEVSALRVLRDGRIETLAGEGLFSWGDADGDPGVARLQHPLGVAALPGGGIAVADTFNSRIRVWEAGRLRTLELSEALDEPGGLDVLPDGRLVIADTSHHRVVTVDIASGLVVEIPLAEPTPAASALSGRSGASLQLTTTVDLEEEDLDLSQGPPIRVSISADPASLLGPGPRVWALSALPVAVEVSLGDPGSGTLVVDVIASTCHGDVCRIRRVTRDHPLVVG